MAPRPRNRFNNNYQPDDIISHNIGDSSSSSPLTGANTISRNRNDHNNHLNSGLSKGAVIGIIVAGVVVILAIVAVVIVRLRRRRTGGSYRAADAGGGFNTREAPIKETEELKPGHENETENAATQGLLRHADAPAIVAWDADEDRELQNAGGTQDGFAYGRGGMIQRPRPASVASFSSLSTSVAPPPRYEEATASSSSSGPGAAARRNSDGGLRPSMLDDGDQEVGRGRSPSRERGPSTDRAGGGGSRPRSVNGDRRRSVSRFTEEGMVDLNLISNR
ncbi:uncharacterized protein PV06_03837 [Exophiala oligosperma]|uniref:Mid2 domain-containing protein n=1 Tax=Exophiala oligosperma TaxID=215243 RepID=A0A0D2DSL3_9EURO|nr:uncharacterized protein PV06_03837 [Exophiala oligosperma]KIW45445.1 hypothetical protein PV06_03837 [Exophiala oligosperma]